MTRKLYWIPGLLAALLLVGAAAGAGEETWQDVHGTAHQMHGKHAVFIGEDDATEFDLSELADGEVRVFGSKDKQVTAERNGDDVTVTHEKGGEAKTRSFTCRIGRDTCKVLTFDNDPEKVMIVVEKTLECRHGVGDCDRSVEVDAIADDTAHVMVKKLVDCEADEDCAKLIDVAIEAGPHHGMHAGAGHNVFVRHLGDDVQILELGDADHVLLRCPEGDATLRVDAEEAEDTFLCPRHSVPLERASTPHMIKVIRKGKVGEDD